MPPGLSDSVVTMLWLIRLVVLVSLPSSIELHSIFSEDSLQPKLTYSEDSLLPKLTYSEMLFETLLSWFRGEQQSAPIDRFLINNLTTLREAVTIQLFGPGSLIAEAKVSWSSSS